MTRWQYLLLFTVFLACAIQPRCANAQEMSRASVREIQRSALIDLVPSAGHVLASTSTATSTSTSTALSTWWTGAAQAAADEEVR